MANKITINNVKSSICHQAINQTVYLQMAKKFISATSIIACLLVLQACQTTSGYSKLQAYPNMYQEKIKSILVLPARNTTTAADAAQLYSATLALPLAEAGYYVLSVPYVESVFANEGIIDGAQLSAIPLYKYQQLFGADAVLFVDISHWNTSYYIAGGNVAVGAKFQLVSTNSGETLWQQNDVVVENTSGDSDSFLFNLIITAINTSTTDYLPLANKVNSRVFNTIPKGSYHPLYGQDQEQSALIPAQTNEHEHNSTSSGSEKRASKVTSHIEIN
ncbi:DUF799 family lipoprotein [Psychrosphaera sp. 1_MG-2023]|uniref:GNA1162 family protein n=1 Tax=Psychrosphaera sp. 1_MG-2023 TaxID=3062643 RepID=UPI0026E338ED|nr:GNA1162 family protein [Psychrosphaera sp. 1_MG-2023]MDO6718566.1 DUF799 family lipoprotein [Psychrosphaera sp. 1_MG-2023]